MRFWDTSALVPVLVEEPATPALDQEFENDPEMVVWWATEVECVSVLARREREGDLSTEQMAAATARLREFSATWVEVQPTQMLRQNAVRLLRVHQLRAADALQLAAAMAAAEGQPQALPIVTLDDQLARAAEREGFAIVQPAVT